MDENMYKQIFKMIKKYNNIVIARHIGVDPDALCSQIALRDSIKLTFPEKNVYAVGAGSARFSGIGKLDKLIASEDTLLIILDTPDKKRVDLADYTGITYSIKIDHHPFMEKFCDLEYMDETVSSTSEIIMDFIDKTKLLWNQKIVETLYMGIVSDSNRFLFNCNSKTFELISKIMKEYEFDITDLYQKLYIRPLNEVRLEGYISLNMDVTENGLGFIKITDDTINKFKVDSASAGNLVNNFNYIDEILVWVTITEDLKNEQVRVSIRSRGPEINKIAEKYNGGGHKLASGVKVKTFEEAMCLIEDLDLALKKYNREIEAGEKNGN